MTDLMLISDSLSFLAMDAKMPGIIPKPGPLSLSIENSLLEVILLTISDPLDKEEFITVMGSMLLLNASISKIRIGIFVSVKGSMVLGCRILAPK